MASKRRPNKELTHAEVVQRYKHYLSRLPAVKYVETEPRYEDYTGFPYIYNRQNDIATFFRMIDGKVIEMFSFQPHEITLIMDAVVSGYAYAEKVKTAEAITQAFKQDDSSGDSESDGVQLEDDEMEESNG